MSRSYLHHVLCVDKAGKKWGKRFANHRVRRLSLDVLSGGAHYKRFYQQYDICDYIFYVSKYTDPEWWEKERRK